VVPSQKGVGLSPILIRFGIAVVCDDDDDCGGKCETITAADLMISLVLYQRFNTSSILAIINNEVRSLYPERSTPIVDSNSPRLSRQFHRCTGRYYSTARTKPHPMAPRNERDS
jgi:hypothetical protein